MTCGIYKITNKINGHLYIGLSKNIEKRWKDHCSHGINGHRKDDLDKPLYLAFKKYGIENFNLEIIEECLESELKEKEKYWIEYYNSYKDRRHYNATPGGDSTGEKSIHLGEDHGMAKLTEDEVKFCRQKYKEGKRSKDIYNEYFSNKMAYSGFQRMWHGKTWKHVMPEVFQKNPHRGKYTAEDRDKIQKLYEERGKYISFNQFTKLPECFVGYGTAWKMIHQPEFYNNK